MIKMAILGREAQSLAPFPPPFLPFLRISLSFTHLPISLPLSPPILFPLSISSSLYLFNPLPYTHSKQRPPIAREP